MEGFGHCWLRPSQPDWDARHLAPSHKGTCLVVTTRVSPGPRKELGLNGQAHGAVGHTTPSLLQTQVRTQPQQGTEHGKWTSCTELRGHSTASTTGSDLL